MKVIGPIQYFQESMLEESLVIRFSFLPKPRMLDFVLVYAGDVLVHKFGQPEGGRVPAETKAPPDFRRIIYEGIDVMNWNGIPFGANERTAAKDSLDLSDGQIVVTEAVCAAQETGYLMKLGLGRFGRYVFSFSSMLVDQRFGQARQLAPGIWEYSDVQTGAVFEFNNPFPDELLP